MTREKKSTRKRIVKTYDYRDESGKLLYQAVRFEPKDFRQRRPNPKNPPDPDPKNRPDPNDPDDRRHWINGLDKDIKLVLYRLNELLDPINIAQGKPVFVVEGEKDVDRFWSIGLVATCNPMGAGKWRQEYSDFLNDRPVVILPDNDKPGQDHAESVARSLFVADCPEIKILDLSDITPDFEKGGDVSDWLDRYGGTKQKLVKLAEDIIPWVPNQQSIEPLGRFFPNEKYNADQLVSLHGDELRYCWKWGWMFYDGKRWNRDEGQSAAEKRARKIAEGLFDLSQKARINEQKTSILNWFNRSLSSRKIQDVLSFARSYDKVSTFSNRLDKDQYLFNCENGTIDLRTGQCRQHNPSDMITKLAPVTYDPNADCPLWFDCLNTWMASHSKIGYLQQLMGMCLTGDICTRVFPIFHGSGKNGKSVFLDTVRELMGDYAWTAAEDLLAEKSYYAHPTEIASLSGRRLVTLDESKPNMILKTSLVKRMTGDRTMQGRFMRQDLFEFHTTHKTILITQNLPIIKETADAIWDRVCLVPWNYRILDDQQNPHLVEDLRAEWPGILKWLIEGCIAWQKAGYTLPASDEIKMASEKYRRESDPLSDFIEEMVLLDMPAESKVHKSELYKAYTEWAGTNEIKYKVSKQSLSKYFNMRGIQDGLLKIDGKTVRVWFGIGLQQ